jgi:hypothetical protein
MLLLKAFGLFAKILWSVPESALRSEYRRRFRRFFRKCPNPTMLLMFAMKCAMHYHCYRLSREMGAGGRVRNSF